MQKWLLPPELLGAEVGIAIAEEQRGLEEDERGIPNGRGSAKGRQDELCGERLNQEQQKGADEQGDGVQRAHGGQFGTDGLRGVTSADGKIKSLLAMAAVSGDHPRWPVGNAGGRPWRR